MSDTYIGIENANEFFTQHYLAALLSGDIKGVLAGWREDAEAREAKPPQTRLSNLWQDFFKLRDRLERERDIGRRVELHTDFAVQLLDALGYEAAHTLRSLETSGELPLLAEARDERGAPAVWCFGAVGQHSEGMDALSVSLVPEQYTRAATEAGGYDVDGAADLLEASVEDVITRGIYGLEEPPRFVLVIGELQVILADRSKWGDQRLLRFDLSEILGRRERGTLDATAVLLHRESLCPDGGQRLLDSLDESSHKHAFAVSENLKYALREAIELLGNEAVWYLGTVRKQKVYGTELSDRLSRECLRYMYRLLFLFYIEARPELGYVPIQSDAYRLGYSLERLRELELLDLSTDEARDGTYIHESLSLLYEMIFQGRSGRQQLSLERQFAAKPQPQPQPEADSIHGGFTLPPLQAHLFDPERTPTLHKVKFRNHVLQRVIELMSLTRPSRGHNTRRGRVSYAQLGINQLGAVYEALLSYRGFFAETDLYEVKPATGDFDVLSTAYFVTDDQLVDYGEEHRVYNTDGTLKKYLAGSFVYRLAGRDRETSASFYTPEVLTKCLVKYALKELLEHEDGQIKLTADELLELTICEPAMGSAAFLNEAVDQLAEVYLRVRQRELDDRIKHEDYAVEKQKVKMLLADNNVFGVDLNPIAVELAEVSLWLNTIFPGGFVPWFGMQLACGNSLVGARRQVFPAGQLDPGKGKKKKAPWLNAVPARVPLPPQPRPQPQPEIPDSSGNSASSQPQPAPEGIGQRPPGSVYHFLLGDQGMSVYGTGTEGAPIRELAKDALASIKAWRDEFCAPLDRDEIEALVELSDAIDRLWARHVEMEQSMRARTTDPLSVYGRPHPDADRPFMSTHDKDAIWQGELFSERVRASSPYRRLRMVMDYWCALWFWPLEKHDLLPSRSQFLMDLSLLLDADVLSTLGGARADAAGQRSLFAPTMDDGEAQELADRFGLVDVDALCERFPRLALVEALRERYRFLHWELEFADVFATRGGFDLVLGNPPWIRVEWKEAGFLGDVDPSFVLRALSATEASRQRDEVLELGDRRGAYLRAHEEPSGVRSFLGAQANYPELQGGKANLYKCFLPLAWRLGTPDGVSAFVHPEGVYDDPKGGPLRAAMYPRLRSHFQLVNEFLLFADITNHVRFGINVFGMPRDIGFAHLANLYTPSTVDACYAHAGTGPVPGIKDDDNHWNVAGHRDRIVWVDDAALGLFARLYDEEGTPPAQARLPALHSRQLLAVLERFAAHPQRLGELGDAFFTTDMWNESRRQHDGTIRRDTRFPAHPGEWVVSGPHFFVGNPFNKTPQAVCKTNRSYDVLDLTALPDDYLPRTNYVPACSPQEYLKRTPRVPWGDQRPVTEFFRLACRAMVGSSSERTLCCAIVPPDVGHVDAVYSFGFERASDLVVVAAHWLSVPYDFFVKVTGKTHFRRDNAEVLPIVLHTNGALAQSARVRVALLQCLTAQYAALWRQTFQVEFREDGWAKNDPRLANPYPSLSDDWTYSTPLRTDFSRRQALVEIDVLVAMALGLTLEELQTIYRVQFPVMRQYEQDTWYDRNGRIVFTNSKGLTGVGLPRTSAKDDPTPCWNDVQGMTSGTVEQVVVDDTLPGGLRERTIVYEAPFDRCDREADYAQAWAVFGARFGVEKGEAAGNEKEAR